MDVEKSLDYFVANLILKGPGLTTVVLSLQNLLDNEFVSGVQTSNVSRWWVHDVRK